MSRYKYLFGFSDKGVLLFSAPKDPGYVDWTKDQTARLEEHNIRPKNIKKVRSNFEEEEGGTQGSE